MSFLDKDGLTYTLQKLKPIIDKKANKNDVYTKEEMDYITDRISGNMKLLDKSTDVQYIEGTKYPRLCTLKFKNLTDYFHGFYCWGSETSNGEPTAVINNYSEFYIYKAPDDFHDHAPSNQQFVVIGIGESIMIRVIDSSTVDVYGSRIYKSSNNGTPYYVPVLRLYGVGSCDISNTEIRITEPGSSSITYYSKFFTRSAGVELL